MSEPENNIAAIRHRAELIADIVAENELPALQFGYLVVELILRKSATSLRCAAVSNATPAQLMLMSEMLDSLAQDTMSLSEVTIDGDSP